MRPAQLLLLSVHFPVAFCEAEVVDRFVSVLTCVSVGVCSPAVEMKDI